MRVMRGVMRLAAITIFWLIVPQDPGKFLSNVGKLLASGARIRERSSERVGSDGSAPAAVPGVRFPRIPAVPTYEGFVARRR